MNTNTEGSRFDKTKLRIALRSLTGALLGFGVFWLTKNPLFVDHADAPGAEWVTICRFFSLVIGVAYVFSALPWLIRPDANYPDPLTITMNAVAYSSAAMVIGLIVTVPLAMISGSPLPPIGRVIFVAANAVSILAAGTMGAYRGAATQSSVTSSNSSRPVRFVVTLMLLLGPLLIVKLLGI